MSNSHSKRPRRSFATEAPRSTSPQHVADGLRYDGEEVPVLIRLPDLSPQALLREPAPTAAAQAAPAPTAPDKKEPDVPEHPKSSQSAASTSAVATPPTAAPLDAEPQAAQAAVEQSSDDQATGNQSNPTDADLTQATPEGSPRKRRWRNRSGREQNGERLDKVQFASQQEPQQPARNRTAIATHVVEQDRNILSFDKSRLLIGASLVIVAGLAYFALSGGDEDPADPAGKWVDGEADSVARTVEKTSEPEADLWPTDQNSPASHEESALAHQTGSSSDAAASAAGSVPVWPTGPGQQPVNSYDPATLPASEYTYSMPVVAAPANGASNPAPRNDGPTLGWPTGPSTPPQSTSATGPVDGWPEAAMATPNTDAPNGAPKGYYASEAAAGNTTSPSTVGGFPDAPAVRTGRLETGPHSGGSINTAANPGSQLNGTIEIPRPRANNEYNGSNVY